jgi:hypothetical protein
MPLLSLMLNAGPGTDDTAARAALRARQMAAFELGEAATLAGRLALMRLLDEVEQQRTDAARVARFLAACWPGWCHLDLRDLLRATPSVATDMLAVLDGLRWNHMPIGEWAPGGYSRIESAAAKLETGFDGEKQEAARRWRS